MTIIQLCHITSLLSTGASFFRLHKQRRSSHFMQNEPFGSGGPYWPSDPPLCQEGLESHLDIKRHYGRQYFSVNTESPRLRSGLNMQFASHWGGGLTMTNQDKTAISKMSDQQVGICFHGVRHQFKSRQRICTVQDPQTTADVGSQFNLKCYANSFQSLLKWF